MTQGQHSAKNALNVTDVQPSPKESLQQLAATAVNGVLFSRNIEQQSGKTALIVTDDEPFPWGES